MPQKKVKKTENKPYPYPKKENYQGGREGIDEDLKGLIKDPSFITSAATAKQFITPTKPMIAVCGKSNVGKSSFINMMANKKRLAKTSSEPGRTRLVNYFDFGSFILADLPGYGFARVSKSEKIKWAKTLEEFFKAKENISHVLMLADSRHDPTEEDVEMIEFLHYHVLPFTVVLTKADKLSKMKLKEHKKAIAADLYLGEGNLLATSAETGYGKNDVLRRIQSVIELQKEIAQADGIDEETDEKDGEEV
ncbi:MAG: YihA family ribosome biogenesis GTP-binding protein [Clostridia bacterium]|nr:YihA family ribosome biogenesis GTP-binding protein [Clostridia bacterium]